MNYKRFESYEFSVDVVRPDNRQYAQQTLELSPSLYIPVEVRVPIKSEYFWDVPNNYYENVLQVELGVDVNVPELPETLNLTPGGLAYLKNELDFVKSYGMSAASSEAESFFEDVDKDF